MLINPVDNATYPRIIRGQISHKWGRKARINRGQFRISWGAGRISWGEKLSNVMIPKAKHRDLGFAFRSTFTSMLLVEGLASVDNLRLPTLRDPSTTTRR